MCITCVIFLTALNLEMSQPSCCRLRQLELVLHDRIKPCCWLACALLRSFVSMNFSRIHLSALMSPGTPLCIHYAMLLPSPYHGKGYGLFQAHVPYITIPS